MGDVVALDEVDDWFHHLILRVDTADGSRRWAWSADEDDDDGIEVDVLPRSALAEVGLAVAQAFDQPELVGAITDVLTEASDVDAVTAGLHLVLGLPQLEPPEPNRGITLFRGDRSGARLAARIAARHAGTTRLTGLDDRWTSLQTGASANQRVLTHGIAATAERRDVVLELWRGAGHAAGFLLAHRGYAIAYGSWNTGWRNLDEDAWQERDAQADALARRLDREAGDTSGLRALLRAQSWSRDPLADLVSLLGVPPEALTRLDGSPDLDQGELIEGMSAWHAMLAPGRDAWHEMLAAGRDAWVPPAPLAPWVWDVLLVTALLSFFVELPAAALGWAAIATDGAFVESDSATAADWALAVLATLSVPFSVWLTVWLVRRASR